MTRATLLDRAKDDLSGIRNNLVTNDDNVLDLCGYLLEQFVEKCLKQYLINKKIYRQFGHETELLYFEAIKVGMTQNKDFEILCSRLDKWEAKTRYSGDRLVYLSELTQYIELAVKEMAYLMETDFNSILNPEKNRNIFINKENKIDEYVLETIKKIPQEAKQKYGDSDVLITANYLRDKIGIKYLENDIDARAYLYKILEL